METMLMLTVLRRKSNKIIESKIWIWQLGREKIVADIIKKYLSLKEDIINSEKLSQIEDGFKTKMFILNFLILSGPLKLVTLILAILNRAKELITLTTIII